MANENEETGQTRLKDRHKGGQNLAGVAPCSDINNMTIKSNNQFDNNEDSINKTCIFMFPMLRKTI